jgi:type IX secretion system PorP/SprF family membrane protein
LKKLLLAFSVVLTAVSAAKAQDIHLTQYFASPLTLNPALTGLMHGDIRVAASYRSQWYAISKQPYITALFSADIATLKGKLPEGDALGIGVIGSYDKSGVGSLQNINVGLSLAYRHAFGENKQHTISFGAQGVMVHKSIDFNKLRFEDQFDPATGYITHTTSTLQHQDLSYPDFNIGLMYSGRISKRFTAYAGTSVFHITTPEESFLDGKNSIQSRVSAQLGGTFDVNKSMILYASALYQTQGSADELVLGAAASFILNPGNGKFGSSTILYLGGRYRWDDAVCPYAGFEWKKLTLGLSYDFTTSSFTPATGGQGAWEISLMFNGKFGKHSAVPSYNFPVPKF